MKNILKLYKSDSIPLFLIGAWSQLGNANILVTLYQVSRRREEARPYFLISGILVLMYLIFGLAHVSEIKGNLEFTLTSFAVMTIIELTAVSIFFVVGFWAFNTPETKEAEKFSDALETLARLARLPDMGKLSLFTKEEMFTRVTKGLMEKARIVKKAHSGTGHHAEVRKDFDQNHKLALKFLLAHQKWEPYFESSGEPDEEPAPQNA